MNQTENALKSSSQSPQAADPETIKSLIADLGSKDIAVRKKAHQFLFDVGESVVRQLVEALSSQNKQIRWEAGKLLEEIDVTWSNHADSKTINALISDLGSKDGLVRVRARMALVTIGREVVPSLKKALASKEDWKRWEAAKALCEIGDPSAIDVLIKALEDEMFDVRWVAAEGLIAIGQKTLEPLLIEITKHADSAWLLEGAHRIFHGLGKDELKPILQPVLQALEGIDVQSEVPFAANAGLKLLADFLAKSPR